MGYSPNGPLAKRHGRGRPPIENSAIIKERLSMKRKINCAMGASVAPCFRLLAACLLGMLWLGLGQATSLRACDVPVFRYALERWEAIPYRLIVLHREPLKDADREIVESLSKATQDEEQPVNLTVQAADLSQEKPEWAQALYKHLESPALPCAVLLQADLAAMYAGPNQGPPGGTVVWSGPLEKNLQQRLLDSPARREIARRLLKGDSAVWLLLESGDKAKDDTAAETISASLKELQEGLKLPDDGTSDNPDGAKPASDDVANIDVSEGVPLKVAFSVLKLSRTDPAEEMFIKMLLATQTEPQAAQSEPETTGDAEAKKDGEEKKSEEKTADAEAKKADVPAAQTAADNKPADNKPTDAEGDKTASKKAEGQPKAAEADAKQAGSPSSPSEIEPTVFAIFGRGRVLGALAGKEIEADSIAGGCEFLTGDCSCMVKDNRPGTDLLMAVNWDKMLAGESLVDQALPPLTGVLPAMTTAADAEKATETTAAGESTAAVQATTPAAVEAATVTAVEPAAAAPVAEDNVVRNLMIVLAVVLGAVAVGTVVLMRRNREQ
jgi:hypothetical protein